MSVREDQVIALAGVSQAALWAHQLASRGHYEEQRLEQAVASVLCTDPETAADVFGGRQNGSIPGIAEGVTLLRTQLGGPPLTMSRSDIALTTRYFGQLLKLATRLQKRQSALDEISRSIERAREASRVLNATHENTIASLAEAYRSTISAIQPRIMVQGNPRYLQNDGYVRAIRVLLLSGVRAGVLWRQCGGRLWHLLLMRSRLLGVAQSL